jgi:hypothetical protein
MSNKQLTTVTAKTKATNIYTQKTFYELNNETGEMEPIQATVIVSQFDEAVDVNWDKIWLVEVLEALEQIGNKKLTVASYIINNRDKRTNYLIQTQQEIADNCKVSRRTVQMTLSALEKADLLNCRTGVYQVNPNCIAKGGHDKRMAILRVYEQNVAKKEKSNKNLEIDK